MARTEAETRTLIWRWLSERPAGRLDRAICEALENAEGQWDAQAPEHLPSRSQIQRMIDEGRVLLNDHAARSSDKITPGCRVELRLPPPRPLELVPEDRPLEILFQDDHLVIVNKPPGLTVHPSETQTEGTLVHALLHHIRDLSGIGGVLRPGIVHRIDKDTSGVLAITKTDAAHHAMAELFAKHDLERRYWALCYGSPRLRPREEKKIESTLGRSPQDRKKMAMHVKDGKHAVTYVRELERYAAIPPGRNALAPFASLLEARLETGRTHQVRVHLTGLGHSLLGDPVYGVPTEKNPKWTQLPAPIRELTRKLPGQALHARLLAFRHPITGQNLRFEAEPPPEYAALLAALRNYTERE